MATKKRSKKRRRQASAPTGASRISGKDNMSHPAYKRTAYMGRSNRFGGGAYSNSGINPAINAATPAAVAGGVGQIEAYINSLNKATHKRDHELRTGVADAIKGLAVKNDANTDRVIEMMSSIQSGNAMANMEVDSTPVDMDEAKRKAKREIIEEEQKIKDIKREGVAEEQRKQNEIKSLAEENSRRIIDEKEQEFTRKNREIEEKHEKFLGVISGFSGEMAAMRVDTGVLRSVVSNIENRVNELDQTNTQYHAETHKMSSDILESNREVHKKNYDYLQSIRQGSESRDGIIHGMLQDLTVTTRDAIQKNSETVGQIANTTTDIRGRVEDVGIAATHGIVNIALGMEEANRINIGLHGESRSGIGNVQSQLTNSESRMSGVEQMGNFFVNHVNGAGRSAQAQANNSHLFNGLQNDNQRGAAHHGQLQAPRTGVGFDPRQVLQIQGNFNYMNPADAQMVPRQQ